MTEVFCPVCDGVGRHYILVDTRSFGVDECDYDVVDCWACEGTGMVLWDVNISEENVKKMFRSVYTDLEKFYESERVF